MPWTCPACQPFSAGPARTFAVPLAFLGAGDWLADVYADGPAGLTVTTQRVTAADSLSIATPTQGGFTVRLCPAIAGATSCG